MNTRHIKSVIIFSFALLLPAHPVAALEPEAEGHTVPSEEHYQALLEGAERARAEAGQARIEAERAAERARKMAQAELHLAQDAAEERERQREEMDRVREELSAAHRELREASREIARAHRELARTKREHRFARQINLGDRAVIGVVLGKETAEGVEVVGVSPGGPAERAGLQAGDVLVSIRGESLAAGDSGRPAGRETLFRIMDEIEAGEAVAVVVKRDGETWNYDVTAERREPSGWQTMIRLPDGPIGPAQPGAPYVRVERIEIPEIDEEALNEQLEALNRELEAHRFLYVSPEGDELEIDEEIVLPDDLDLEIGEFSHLAGQALREADLWFGLSHARGLELAKINEGLGTYFKTERGVLVLRAREDNAYQLHSGDVVLKVDATEVSAPSDLMRALREIEPGSEFEIAIMRDRKRKTLQVTMPERRLGFFRSPQPHHVPNH